MIKRIYLLTAALLAFPLLRTAAAQPDQSPKAVQNVGRAPTTPGDDKDRADRRYDEMLGKMQAAVEEIAQLYGNPTFLQVFTNDVERAADLKERIRAARTGEELRTELAELRKKREDLLNDIALKERDAAKLTSRLVRQRAALDGIGDALEQARKAVEESSR